MMKGELSDLYKKILNDALLRLKELLKAESASYFLFDVERQELVLNSVLNEQKVQFRGLRQRIGDGVAGSVAFRRQPVLVKDIKKDPRFPDRKFRHYHTDSFLCVPITSGEKLVAVMNFSDKTSGEAFTEADFACAVLVVELASALLSREAQLANLEDEIGGLHREHSELKDEHAMMEKFASMGKLAGGIVHEINNPLDAVLRYTNLLIEKDPEREVAREYLNEIKVGLTRMTKITRSLLEFSQQLKDNPHQDVVDVHGMIEEALSLFRHTLFTGFITIEKDLDDALPPVIDKGLCRVFSNLVKNAFDAMPNGGTLFIRTRLEGDQIVATFRDTGCGIADDVKEKIFTPFFTTKPIGQGVGLGLPICFEVVQRYGGHIDVASVIGEGTEFRVRLPLTKASPAFSRV
jgi:signal transduction histidine kinase